MAGFEPRFYRSAMGKERWISFRVVHRETDLWIAVDKESYKPAIESHAFARVKYYRELLNIHIAAMPYFLSTLIPIPYPSFHVHQLITDMYAAAEKSGTGPMSAVAGAMAEHVCNDIIKAFRVNEIVIENGGDIFMNVTSPAIISVYAGTSPLSEKIGIEITPENSPVSVCCSSGTIGHSLSFGLADACMIACRSGAQADAYATAFCNEVKSKESVNRVTELALKRPDILSVVIIKDDVAGIGGKLEVKVL